MRPAPRPWPADQSCAMVPTRADAAIRAGCRTLFIMIKFLAGILIGICLVFLAGYLFVTRGGLPMSTAGEPLPMERFLARKAISASIGGSAQAQSPLPADETNLLAGAHIYQ